MKKILGLICVMLFAGVLVACGGNSGDELVGTWRNEALSDIIGIEVSLTFEAGGRGTETWEESTWDFEWEVSGTSGNNLSITFDDEDEANEMTFVIDDDVLTITGNQALEGDWRREQ